MSGFESSGVVCNHFSIFLSLDGRIWDLIVSVPDHCLSFYFDPRGRRGNILVSEHAFLSVICRDGTK